MRFKQAFSCNADIGKLNGTGASGPHIYDPNVRPSQWAVWRTPGRRRPARFSMARQAYGRLIVARDDSGRNADSAMIYLLFFPGVFMED
jgi:hypothetical protein